MDTYRTDEEQIEAVKQWWKENGLPIVTGLVIGLGGIFGWRGWQAWEQAQAEAASDIFQVMINSVRDKNADAARESAQQLLDEYASTIYAVQAAFTLAKLAVDDGDFAAARTQLEFAATHAPGGELRQLADLRLARVMLAENKLDEALALLTGRDFGAASASADELKGDILAMKGDQDGAQTAYRSALAATPQDSDEYEVLSLKLDSVNISVN